MASQAWLDSSLRRSASLGLEVLERASRRGVDWTSCSSSQAPSDGGKVKNETNSLDDAFKSITEFMSRTTRDCQKFYDSGSCAGPSDAEKRHVSRFHGRPEAETPTLLVTGQDDVSAVNEQFYIELTPGDYVITASCPESERQSRLVSIGPGDSVSITFHL